jgi:hypothetical protein
MASFLYPTEDCFHDNGSTWLDRMRDQFKASNRQTFTFAWLKSGVRTLPDNGHPPYFMYFYFSQSRSEKEVHNQVPYRVRIVATSTKPLHHNESELPDVHRGDADRRIYFRADLIEEIRSVDGSDYLSSWFEHEKGDRQPRLAAHNSIPPVRRTEPLVVVQRTSWELAD